MTECQAGVRSISRIRLEAHSVLTGSRELSLAIAEHRPREGDASSSDSPVWIRTVGTWKISYRFGVPLKPGTSTTPSRTAAKWQAAPTSTKPCQIGV
jgi:hypothetical protein